MLSSGGGNFTARTVSIPGSGGGYPIANGDFNTDGKADIALFAPLGIAFGDGNGGFTPVQPISWSNANQNFSYAKAQVADFNGDGKPDLAIGFDTLNGTQPSTFQVVVFINNGSGFNDRPELTAWDCSREVLTGQCSARLTTSTCSEGRIDR